MSSNKRTATVERKRIEKLEREHKTINGIDNKLCNKHHIYFPEENPWIPATLDYFYYNDKNGSDFLHPCCKRCGVKTTQKNYDLDRRKVLNYGYYHNDEEYRLRQIAYAQTPEYKENAAEWRRKNPEKCREYTQKHRIHDITDAEWRKELEVFNYECAYCGIVEKESLKIHKQKLHKEHIDNKGYNDLRNASPACRSCNSSKHEDSLDEWYPKQKFFTQERYNKIQWWLTEGYKDYIEDKPPYRILRKRNEGLTTYHWNLWSVDEMRNTLEIIATGNKKKDLDKDIKEYLKLLANNNNIL